MRPVVLLTLLSTMILCPSPGRANLIANPSFEVTPLSPWQYTGTAIPHLLYHYDGDRSFFAMAVTDVTLSQTVNTTPGQYYDLSFWLMNVSIRPPVLVVVKWGADTVLTLVDEPLMVAGVGEWHNYVVPSLQALAGTTTLQFTFHSWQGLALDLVSLEESPSAVPEPANVILVGTALLPLLFLRRLWARRES